MARAESFAAVLNDYLAKTNTSDSLFVLRVGVHPTTLAELKCGLDPCNSMILGKIVKSLRLDREWAARFYVALPVERDGEELSRAAGLIE